MTKHSKKKIKKYKLQEVEEPNLFRDDFPYTTVPKIAFDHKAVPREPAENFWITCTTFRDGLSISC